MGSESALHGRVVTTASWRRKTFDPRHGQTKRKRLQLFRGSVFSRGNSKGRGPGEEVCASARKSKLVSLGQAGRARCE